MEPKREVTFVVHRLLNQMRRLSNPEPLDLTITPMQGRVIGFVKHREGTEVFQRDLEREFQIRRSTASAILQTMERSDLIQREAVPHDARLKKLVLTPRAETFHEHFRQNMIRAEAIITRGVSQRELDAFFRVASKFEKNLKQYAADPQSNWQNENHGEEME